MNTLKREAEASICLDLKERLSSCVRILARIDENRERSHEPGLGRTIERQIIGRELRELELDIMTSPGALASSLVKVRPRSR
jgi:hypothetical protein